VKRYGWLTVVTVLLAAVMATAVPVPVHGGRDRLVVGVHTLRASDDVLQLAAGGDFGWLVQLLEWREVEPVAGEHFWAYADWLVRATEFYGLELVLRLDHAPSWASTPDQAAPVDVFAYAQFVGLVAERYRGRVRAYILWNEPNLAVEWGGRSPDAAGYVQLLCAARAAIQAADPEALVVSAGLAPTNHVDGTAVDDRLYLRSMYGAGASACFDVLGAHPYGFAHAPGDPPQAHDGLNVSRLADLRAIMVEHGDTAKPVWATEVGWTTDPAGAASQWLRVSPQQQAAYLVQMIDRALDEWPWLERIAVWNLGTGFAPDDEKRGYSLLNDDGTAKPALDALVTRIQALEDDGKEEVEAGAKRVPVVEVLAPDVVVRLSDVDTAYPHWARPHCGLAPCRLWQGQFYIGDPGADPWLLRMETMQVEEPGNLVFVNGQPLNPPAIPRRGRPDYASVWTALEMPVPAQFLRSGVNVIEIHAAPRLPVYQDERAEFESLQLRHVRLIAGF
jgi:hypothetical protein